jgi:hypothetical protein
VKAITITHNRSLSDSPGYAIYVEIISLDNEPKYHIGTQILADSSGKPTKIEAIITHNQTAFTWMFNATSTLIKILEEEKAGGRSVIADANRDSRRTLKQAADTYLDLYGNGKESSVPFALGCTFISIGLPVSIPCTYDKPPQLKSERDDLRVVDRRYVIDETVGAVEVFATYQSKTYGGSTYDVCIERGNIQCIHTIAMTYFRSASKPPITDTQS